MKMLMIYYAYELVEHGHMDTSTKLREPEAKAGVMRYDGQRRESGE